MNESNQQTQEEKRIPCIFDFSNEYEDSEEVLVTISADVDKIIKESEYEIVKSESEFGDTYLLVRDGLIESEVHFGEACGFLKDDLSSIVNDGKIIEIKKLFRNINSRPSDGRTILEHLIKNKLYDDTLFVLRAQPSNVYEGTPLDIFLREMEKLVGYYESLGFININKICGFEYTVPVVYIGNSAGKKFKEVFEKIMSEELLKKIMSERG